MKILLIADQAEPTLWEHLDRRRLEGVELILSCGDLPADYLSFLTCFTDAPILYVHGNHDDRYAQHPPEGCICIEDTIYTFNGLRILGLGGSMRYNNGVNQYTERQRDVAVHVYENNQYPTIYEDKASVDRRKATCACAI